MMNSISKIRYLVVFLAVPLPAVAAPGSFVMTVTATEPVPMISASMKLLLGTLLVAGGIWLLYLKA